MAFGARVNPAESLAVIVPLLVIVVTPNPICPAPCTTWFGPITSAVVAPGLQIRLPVKLLMVTVPLPLSVTVPPPTNCRSVRLPEEFKLRLPLLEIEPAPAPLFSVKAMPLFTVRLSTASVVRLLIVTEMSNVTLEPLLRTAEKVFPPPLLGTPTNAGTLFQWLAAFQSLFPSIQVDVTAVPKAGIALSITRNRDGMAQDAIANKPRR